MDRLHHLMETLPANIASNKGYKNLEFVLLDYNSGDDMAEWVQKNFYKELRGGTLVFSRTDKPTHFKWSHSRNIAFALANGDIVCNIDADNFTGPDFAGFINNHFQKNPNSFLSVNYRDNFNNLSDTFGRITCYKEDFEAIGGFDERMEGYSYEDVDFCLRLKLLGREQHFVRDKRYLGFIKHGYGDRFSHSPETLKTRAILINYVSPFKSRILFLFKDSRFAYGTLQDLNEGMGNPTIKEGKWLIGKSKADKHNNLIIDMPEYSLTLSPRDDNYIDQKGNVYHNIRDEMFRRKLETVYSIVGNHQILVNNMREKRIRVNS